MGALSFLQFLGLQNSCLATAKVLPLDTVIMALLLQSAWSGGYQAKFCPNTANSAGHKCHSPQQMIPPARDLPISYFSHTHLTHHHALPPLYPPSVGSKPGLIHGVTTCAQLKLTRNNCQEGHVHAVNPKQADHPPCHPSGNSHLSSHAPLADPFAI